jgi:hypothetical protein
MGGGTLASPDAKRVQTICWKVCRSAACPAEVKAISSTTQGTAGKSRGQRAKSVDDITVPKLTRSTENFIYFGTIPIVPSRVSAN